MDLRQLEMFQAVADNQSFTVAGEKLYVAQSAISRQVRLLEEELGQHLFRRTNKKVLLTAAGEVMLSYTRRAFKELREAILEASSLSDMDRGIIRIGAGITACMYLLPPVIEQFQAKYPKVQLQVTTGPVETLIPQLRNAVLDIGVMTLPIHHPDLTVTPCLTEEMVVVASPRNQSLSRRRSLRATELSEYPLITFPRTASTRTLLNSYFDRIGIQPRIVTESDSVATIKPLVGANLGIGIVPLPAVLPERKRGELHILFIRDHKCFREIGVVTPRSARQPAVISDLVQLFCHVGATQLSTRRV